MQPSPSPKSQTAEPFRQLRILRANIEQVIRGKEDVVKLAVVALLAKGHLLIEDIPGVGKTTLASALARSLDCTFRRVSFTSDLLPSDIIGVTIFNSETREFEFKPGPIFTNVLLADEINRTTPKTQSALLEAMSEFRVSVNNRQHNLPDPFFVLATQNPVEHHGTYPLPDSQLDRFLLRIEMGYPQRDAEKEIIVRQRLTHPAETLQAVLTGDELVSLQKKVREIRVEDAVLDYMLAVVEATRSAEACCAAASEQESRSACKKKSAERGLTLRASRLPLPPLEAIERALHVRAAVHLSHPLVVEIPIVYERGREP